MTIDVKEYERLRSRVNNLKEQAAQARGAREQILKNLKSLGCDSKEDAEAQIKRLTKKKKRLERDFNEALEKFKEQWGELLDGDSDED